MPSPDYTGKETLQVQHLKLPVSIIHTVKAMAAEESRQMGWIYRNILAEATQVWRDKQASQKAKRAAAKKNGGK